MERTAGYTLSKKTLWTKRLCRGRGERFMGTVWGLRDYRGSD